MQRSVVDLESVEALRKALTYIIDRHENGVRRRLNLAVAGQKLSKVERFWDTNPVLKISNGNRRRAKQRGS